MDRTESQDLAPLRPGWVEKKMTCGRPMMDRIDLDTDITVRLEVGFGP